MLLLWAAGVYLGRGQRGHVPPSEEWTMLSFLKNYCCPFLYYVIYKYIKQYIKILIDIFRVFRAPLKIFFAGGASPPLHPPQWGAEKFQPQNSYWLFGIYPHLMDSSRTPMLLSFPGISSVPPLRSILYTPLGLGHGGPMFYIYSYKMHLYHISMRVTGRPMATTTPFASKLMVHSIIKYIRVRWHGRNWFISACE